MGHNVVVVGARLQGAIAEGFHLETGAHATEVEIAQPQLPVGETGLTTETVQQIA